jgi:hypothetical protein
LEAGVLPFYSWRSRPRRTGKVMAATVLQRASDASEDAGLFSVAW